VRRLVIRPGAIGDTIVSLPALERLCSLAPGLDYAEIWAPSRNLPLLRHLAPVRSFPAVQLDLLEIAPPRALIERLQSFDEIVSWYGAAREEFRAALQATGVSFRLFQALPPQGAGCHAVDFYLRQAGLSAPDAAPGAAPRIPVTRREDSPRRPFIAIQPFSGSPKKNWELASFQTVARQLEEASGLGVEWCAGPEEELPGAQRFEWLDEVAGWLAGASLYIGNDSGITHLAAACGVPVVAIFQVTDAAVWSPRGPHVAVLQSPNVAQVIEAALTLLDETGS
jgi:ADP-heptose:LPS heptosyltransferase